MSTVYRLLEEGRRPLYTYGPIIHNEWVVEDLESRGVRILKNEEDLRTAPRGTLVIRSHGVTRREQELMEQLGFAVVDATCPFVKKIHRLAQEASEEGKELLITGDPEHPEVQGICGWSRVRPLVIRDEGELPALSKERSYVLLSQTTFNQKKFAKIVANLEKNGYYVYVVNTICNATQRRQSEAEEISRKVDSMIVIGGRESSNTRKLYDICKAHCASTYLIQSLDDLCNQGFAPVRSVGITAGASTPKNIIEEVHSYVRSKF